MKSPIRNQTNNQGPQKELESKDIVSFAFYARLVKNLRAVILFLPGDREVDHRINWLKKRFHYRNLGVPPSLYIDKLYRDSGRNVFRKLYYPVIELRELSEIITSLGYPDIFVEALMLASTYISPLFILSKKFIKLVDKYSIHRIPICKELDVRDWKLHMRIADYSILDFYEEMIDLNIEYIESLNNLEKRRSVLEKRRIIVEKDSKRYWRITCEGGDKIFLYYLDPLLLLEENIDKVKNKILIEYAPGLSIIPVVNLLLI